MSEQDKYEAIVKHIMETIMNNTSDPSTKKYIELCFLMSLCNRSDEIPSLEWTKE